MSAFLWSKAYERPINILCWPRERGGLGLISLKTRPIVLKFQRMKQYLQREDSDFWKENALHILMRFHIDMTYRATINANLLQHGNGSIFERVGNYYKTVNFYEQIYDGIVEMRSLEKYGKSFDNYDIAWVNKIITEEYYQRERRGRDNWIILDSWGWTANRELKIWRQIFHEYMDPKIKSFGWKVVHGILSTNYRISKGERKIVADGKCSCCSRLGRDEDETIEHLLIECWVAKIVWNKVNFALRSAGLNEVSKIPEEIIARVHLNKAVNYIVAETGWAIWRIRCNDVFDNHKRTWQQAIFILRRRLNLRYIIDAKYGKVAKWDKLDTFLRNLGVT